MKICRRLESPACLWVLSVAASLAIVLICPTRSSAAQGIVENEKFGGLMSELIELTSDFEDSMEEIRALADLRSTSRSDWMQAAESLGGQSDKAWSLAALSSEYSDDGDIMEGQVYGFLEAWARSVMSGVRALEQAVSLMLEVPDGSDMSSEGNLHVCALTALLISAETCDNVAVMCGISALNTLIMASGFRFIMDGVGQ